MGSYTHAPTKKMDKATVMAENLNIFMFTVKVVCVISYIKRVLCLLEIMKINAN